MVIRGKTWLGIALEFPKPFYFSVKQIKMKESCQLSILKRSWSPRLPQSFRFRSGHRIYRMRHLARTRYGAGLWPSSWEGSIPVRVEFCGAKVGEAARMLLIPQQEMLLSAVPRGFQKTEDWSHLNTEDWGSYTWSGQNLFSYYSVIL